MREKVVVTVAPGERISLAPHPSGLPDLPALVLEEGERLRVTLEEAQLLYEQHKVCGLVSGKPKPRRMMSEGFQGPLVMHSDSADDVQPGMRIVDAGAAAEANRREREAYERECRVRQEAEAVSRHPNEHRRGHVRVTQTAHDPHGHLGSVLREIDGGGL